MTSALPYLSVVLVVGMLFAATINITLRRLSRARLAEALPRGDREHLLAQLIAEQNELALGMATLRTFCSLALILCVHRMCVNAGLTGLAAQYGAALAIAVALVLVFGVAVPAAWSRYAGEAFLARVLRPLLFVLRGLYPILVVLGLLDALVRRLAGVPAPEDADEAARHERELLDAVSESEKLGAVDEEEKEMIESVIDLRDSDVAEIMTPRTEIAAVDKNASLAQIKDVIRDAGHSRIPIYEETIDNVIGIIYAKDLLHLEEDKPFSAGERMRPALFIPETKNVRDLLHEFQTEKVHMAIVLDEYGGTAGLVTIEDILEELVGEIADEYDQDEPAPMVRVDENTVEIDARMRVDELNEELDLRLPDEDDYETIGGLVCTTLGRIPAVGESCAYANVSLEVLEAEPRRVGRLRLRIERDRTAAEAKR